MKNKPIFSIIIPAYNVEEYIENTLQSVFNQTFKNYEIIIIDDCSTDSTVKVIEKLIKQNSNIKITLLKNKINLKQGASRNKGIEFSTGEYILFLDSDDSLFDDNVLSNLNDIIFKNHPDIIYSGLKAIGVREFEIIPTKENCDKEYRLSEYKWANVTTICWNSSLIKNNNIKFPENILFEDVYFNFLGICKAESYEIGNFISYLYNTRPSSSMGNKQFNQVRDTISLIENLYNLKDKIDPKYINCLNNRIEQQKSRIIPRLNRILEQ